MTRKPPPATPDAEIDVSIIVCTKDRSADLKDMLVHLSRARVPSGWKVELVIVDNGSTDDTKAVTLGAELPNLTLRYVYESRRGKAAGLTAGIEAGAGRALLLTADDVHVPANWTDDTCRPRPPGEAADVPGGT